MLDQLEPGQFQELVAATIVGLNPDQWRQVAMMTSAICNQLQVASDSDDPVFSAEDFLPEGYRELMGLTQEQQAAEILARSERKAKARFG